MYFKLTVWLAIEILVFSKPQFVSNVSKYNFHKITCWGPGPGRGALCMGGGPPLGGGGAPSRTCVIDMAPLGGAADDPRPRAVACGDPRTAMPPRLCISCAADEPLPRAAAAAACGDPRTTMPPRPRDVIIGEAPRPLTTPLEAVGRPRTPRDETGVPPRVATIPEFGNFCDFVHIQLRAVY